MDVAAADDAGCAATPEALRVLQVTCPYNRASVQLPLVLHALVSETDPEALDPLIQSDWAYLRKGLDAHVAVLDALDADLPLPAEGDYLYGRLYPDAPITRAQLADAEDPVWVTRTLLSSIQFVVSEYDDATLATIDEHVAVVESKTAGQWPLKVQIMGWRAALQRMQPFLEDEAHKDQVAQLIFAIDEYVGLRC